MLLGTNGLKTLLVLKIFKFLSLKNRLDKKARVNFKIYNVKNRETNNISISQRVKLVRQ